MIQVIKYGRQRYEITCPRCKCRFSFDKTDIEKIGPLYDRLVRIHCPDCHYKITEWDIDALIRRYS